MVIKSISWSPKNQDAESGPTTNKGKLRPLKLLPVQLFTI